MGKCDDCWCEHYDKTQGICDNCIKKESEKERPDLRVILKKRAVEQMGLDNTGCKKGQSR